MTSTTTDITIRQAEPADFETIISLLKEFAQFQKTPDHVSVTSYQMQEDKDLFHCLIAETSENRIVGFVTFFPAYYSWSGKAMYIDDLYVTETYRNKGIGKKLLDAVVAIAKEKNCKKVRWQVSDWNTKAIGFYKNTGAVMNDTERNCDLML